MVVRDFDADASTKTFGYTYDAAAVECRRCRELESLGPGAVSRDSFWLLRHSLCVCRVQVRSAPRQKEKGAYRSLKLHELCPEVAGVFV